MGAGFDRLLGQSCSCGARDRPNPAPRPGEPLTSYDNQKATRGSSVHQRKSPCSYLFISPPGSPDQKANQQSDVRKHRYPRTWAGVWGNIDREFRTQRRPLNVASVLRRTVRAGDVAPYARPGPPGSRQLDDRCKTFHQLFGLAGFFELDLDHVSGDRDHGTGAKGLVAHGIARGKVL